MDGPSPDPQQNAWMNELRYLLNPQDALCRLADRIPWSVLEERFAPLYATGGRPSKPIRLMAGLLMLKHLCNVSDEVVVRQWCQNPYWQYFTGMTQFQWKVPGHLLQ